MKLIFFITWNLLQCFCQGQSNQCEQAELASCKVWKTLMKVELIQSKKYDIITVTCLNYQQLFTPSVCVHAGHKQKNRPQT